MTTDQPSNFSSKHYRLLLRVLVLVYAANLFSLFTADPDLWGHLRFGQDILTEGALPDTDSYSYTAQGHPWINHEWLTEVLFHLVYTIAGSTGLLIFKLGLGLLIIHILSTFYLRREGNPLVFAVYFALLIPVMAPGFMTRPHLMTHLFTTLLIVMLHKFFEGSTKILAWSPLLMLLWVNCHGGVVAGTCIFGLVAGLEWVRCLFTKEKTGRIILGWFVLCCLALLINPYGYKLWLFFLESLKIPRDITEWNAVPLLAWNYWEYKLLALFFLATLFTPGRKRIWEIAVIGCSVYFGFKHQRHTVLAGIIMTPTVPLALASLVRKVRWESFLTRLSPGFHNAARVVLVLFIGIQAYDGFDKYRLGNFKILVEPQVYPTYAAQFMEANGIDANIVVPFDWGEYIIWKRPQSRVSIDGRFRTVYPEEIIRQNQNFASGKPGWQEILEKYPTDIVLTRKLEGTHKLLEGEANWVKIYEDPISMIFIRKTEPPSRILKKFLEKKLINPEDPPPREFPG